MLYRILRPLTAVALKYYFKKIHIENADAIPHDKPVFIAMNHPTAWIEPCLLACFLPESLNFMVRGNLFTSEFRNKIMASVHLIPIHRQSDGDKNHHSKNLETFKYCYEALAENKTILIMPEGSTAQIKRLRPLKKGLGRICFGAIDNSPGLDIHIVPIGANFTYPNDPRNEVYIKVGEPIRVLDFYENNRDLPARGIRQLMGKVKEGMLETVIHVADESDDILAEQLFQVARSSEPKTMFPILEKGNSKLLKTERKIASKINDLSEEAKANWKEKTSAYFEKLETHNLKESYFENGNSFFKYFLLLLGFLPAFLGAIFNYPPIALADYVRKNVVTQLEFEQPIWMSILIVLIPIYYLCWAIGGFFIDEQLFWGVLFAMPLWGYIYLIYRELWSGARNNSRFSKLSKIEKEELAELKKEVLKLMV